MDWTNQTHVAHSVPDDEINLLDYWRVIWKHWRTIGRLSVASVLSAMVVSFKMPKICEKASVPSGVRQKREGYAAR